MIPDLLTLSLNLIILQWFSLCLKHFEKYVTARKKTIFKPKMK